MMATDEWMTTADVARALGYTQAWVRSQILSGRLPAQQHIGDNRRSYRIRRADYLLFVQRWITQS